MEATNPFKTGGPTIAVLGSFAVTPSGTLLGFPKDWNLVVTNRSAAQDAYLAYGPTSTAVASAVVPVTGAPGNATQNVLSVPFRTTQTFTFSGPTFFAPIVGATNAILDLTPGEGS